MPLSSAMSDSAPWVFQSLYFDQKPSPGRVVDLFAGEGRPRQVAVFFIHGGGWSGGSRSNYHFAIRELTKLGYDCASTDYRLAGVDVFTQVADIREGLDLFMADLKSRGRATRIVVAGQSAGAHLALLTALARPEECGLPKNGLRHEVEIAGAMVEATPFTFEPWSDIFPHIWGSMQRIIGASHATAPQLYTQASPLTYVRPAMPPIFSLHAGNEHMFPMEQAMEFADRMREVGGDFTWKLYPRVEHGFFYALDRAQQREALTDMLAFLDRIQGS